MKKTAFTLVELSIVLLIIGLIIGGITAGTSLIRQANLRAVMSELTQYMTAVNSFYVQFNYLPGDMPNATAFWYNATSCPGTTGVAGLCNGNGNGTVENSNCSSMSSDETARLWQHLSLAGLIQGNYSGVRSAACSFDAGTVFPLSKAAPNIYTNYPYLWYSNANLSLALEFVTPQNTAAYMLPKDAFAIDTKLDDGGPKTGRVMGGWSDDTGGFSAEGAPSGTGCVIGSSSSYRLSSTTDFCIMHYIIR